MISAGHARALLAISDVEKQYSVAMRIFDEKLSVMRDRKAGKDNLKPIKEKRNFVI